MSNSARTRAIPLIALMLGVTFACGRNGAEVTQIEAPSNVRIETTATTAEGAFKTIFTCDGDDTSPPLSWSGSAPVGWALTMVDVDAPDGEFVHWLVYRIDASVDRIAAGRLPPGAVEGRNDFGEVGYGGPCPPAGDDPHRYVVTIYALDSGIGELDEGASIGDLLRAIRCCVTGTGTLTATYGR